MCVLIIKAINESVTAVQGGVVGNNSFDEIVASTYTGNITNLRLFVKLKVIYKICEAYK